MTIAFRAPPKGCIHHTDRGRQYFSHDYQKILRQHGFKLVRASGLNDPGDQSKAQNAAIETFFKTIKADWRRSWDTPRQTRWRSLKT